MGKAKNGQMSFSNGALEGEKNNKEKGHAFLGEVLAGEQKAWNKQQRNSFLLFDDCIKRNTI